jgi:hypothetical protein
MTDHGFRDALATAGLSIAAFSRLSKVTSKTVSRWKDDAPGWAFVLLAQYQELNDLRRKDAISKSLHRDAGFMGKGGGYEL